LDLNRKPCRRDRSSRHNVNKFDSQSIAVFDYIYLIIYAN